MDREVCIKIRMGLGKLKSEKHIPSWPSFMRLIFVS